MVIPTASSIGPEVVEVYDALFRRLGAAEVVTMHPQTREDAYDPELRERLASATGIFMTGGNQLKLSAMLCGTPLYEEIVAAHERGRRHRRHLGRRRASSRATWSPSADRARPPSSG